MRKILNNYPYTIDVYSTALECLIKFEENNVHTLCVIDSDRVVGTITDGDIRKSLIKSRSLNILTRNIMRIDFKFVTKHDEISELFNKFPHLFLIPVVDDDMKIVSLYTRF